MRYPKAGEEIQVYFQQYAVKGTVIAVDVNVEAQQHWVLLSSDRDEMVQGRRIG